MSTDTLMAKHWRVYMIKKRPTVEIVIPAYNEEANIGSLLNILFEQSQLYFSINKIVVNSDGSVDGTVAIASKFKNKGVVVVNNHERKGINFRLGQSIKKCESDILVILNADIVPLGNKFIYNLIQPILKNKADFTCSKSIPSYPFGIFEKTLFVGEEIKTKLFESINNSNNIYTCRGTARAFNKLLYSNLQFIPNLPDDAFSYLWAIKNKYIYQFSKEAVLIFKLPSNLKDYLRQGKRFYGYQKKLKQYFSFSYLKQEYKIDKTKITKFILLSFLKSPIYTFIFLFVWIFQKIENIFSFTEVTDIWEISKSTKIIKKAYE